MAGVQLGPMNSPIPFDAAQNAELMAECAALQQRVVQALGRVLPHSGRRRISYRHSLQ